MGVAEHEEEPVNEWQYFCNVHEMYFYKPGPGCIGCACDEADRQYGSKLDERGREK